ncbi:hypothetical protein ACFQX7_00950 [Luedemannella flava]
MTPARRAACTLRLEARTCAPPSCGPPPAGLDGPTLDALVRAAVAEVAATTGFTEAHYDRAGRRRVPTCALPAPGGGPALFPRSPKATCLLVTGGGKGSPRSARSDWRREPAWP